ncbi:hypothetical protein H6P81_019560 [Aristolochia fimbriata]|uniref:Uncharacterized protein n=1 Tax=Aristolochia fimbriata TaxID=158543 RepID=A0AAV7DS19_ARIFI|nr:hypothetical protein H6P81_019560 [Aristolochia fimbriata]
MADASDLEKMGRELKCPICLSLLNSVVSLTCNHVFCKSCILKSIKRASNCPVCKVPFHRREVRSAPHMDTLVSIYKSMELASGVNTFVTQPTCPNSDSGRGGNGSNFDEPKGSKINRGKSKKQKTVQQIEGDLKIANSRVSDSQTSGKPSFPANKRVQVPPIPEASLIFPTIPNSKAERESNKSTGEEYGKDCSNSSYEKSTFDGNGNSVFCPFFWLKETDENEENSDSQSYHLTDEECIADTPTHKPSFSDIKDSQSPNSMASKEWHGTSKALDFQDSEMFEWTQRACSPELCSTPIKKQNAMDKGEQNFLQEKHGSAFMDMQSSVFSQKQAKNSGAGTTTAKSITRSKPSKQKVGKHCLKKSVERAETFTSNVRCETSTVSRGNEEVPTSPRLVAVNSSEGNECVQHGAPVNSGRKTSKRDNIHHSKRKSIPEEVLGKSKETTEIPNGGNESEEINKFSTLGRKSRKQSSEFISNPKRKLVKLSINEIDEGSDNKVVEESQQINQGVDRDPGHGNQPADKVIKRMNSIVNDAIEKILVKIPNESRETADNPYLGGKDGQNKPKRGTRSVRGRSLSKKNQIKDRGSKRSDRDGSLSREEQIEDSVRDRGQEDYSSNDKEAQNKFDEKTGPKCKCTSEENLLSSTAIRSDYTSTEMPTNTRKETEKDIQFSKLPVVEAGNDENLGEGNTISKKCGKVKTKFETRSARSENLTREATINLNTINAVIVEDRLMARTETAENEFLPSVHDKNEVVLSAKNPLLQKCNENPFKIECAFCHSCDISEVTGEMVHYSSGKLVAADYNGASSVIHSHKKCAEWAPNVYFEEDEVINLEAEISRSRRIKCSCCGIKGAALGCYVKGCRRSFHVPCAKITPQCRWDYGNFVMLCPLHSNCSLPKENSKGQNRKAKQLESVAERSAQVSRQWMWPSGSPKKWVLCCSSLSAEEKESVSKLTKLAGISLAKTWNPAVTHVIASTDENGACKRTLKFLMGILEGKWILKADWVKACLTALQPVNEEMYEVEVDIHGVKGGPREGRERVINKGSKLFHNLEFYLVGEFTVSYKGYLHDLIITGGGVVLHRKPISRTDKGSLEESSPSTIYVIYSVEQPDKSDAKKTSQIFARRKAEACSIASSINAKIAPHSWVLDSIAASKLQALDKNTA